MNTHKIQPIHDPDRALSEIAYFVRVAIESECEGDHRVARAVDNEVRRLVRHAPQETIEMIREMGVVDLLPPHSGRGL